MQHRVPKRVPAMFLEDGTRDEFKKINIGVCESKATKIDSISTKRQERASSVLSLHRIQIFNISFSTGTFPDCHKLPRDTLAFRSGTRTCTGKFLNYFCSLKIE